MSMLEDKQSPRTARGDPNLTIVVFTDYRCPACRKAHRPLHSAVARERNVELIYRDWPIFGEQSEQAAKVALASHRQGIYPAVHDALMRSPAFDDAALRAAVEGAGGNWQQVEADMLAQGPAIEKQITATKWDAFTLGLQGTPAYLIGPVLVQGALTEREFARAFRQARAAL
jgi:protein-disulfide isomerase